MRFSGWETLSQKIQSKNGGLLSPTTLATDVKATTTKEEHSKTGETEFTSSFELLVRCFEQTES